MEIEHGESFVIRVALHRNVPRAGRRRLTGPSRVDTWSCSKYSQGPTLCEGSELSTVTLILGSDCTLIFTVLLLLVEGFKVFVALRFDVVYPRNRDR